MCVNRTCTYTISVLTGGCCFYSDDGAVLTDEHEELFDLHSHHLVRGYTVIVYDYCYKLLLLGLELGLN